MFLYNQLFKNIKKAYFLFNLYPKQLNILKISTINSKQQDLNFKNKKLKEFIN